MELDSIKKYRNTKEWRTIPRASCCGHERIGDGPVIPPLCQDLIDAGFAPSMQVEVYRSGTLCFAAKSLDLWASGKAMLGDQPEHLKRLKR
jgi:hypothetical protein